MTKPLYLAGVFAVVIAWLDLQPQEVENPPLSIRQSFSQEHPGAREGRYRLMSDDAGLIFEVSYLESGTRKTSEYRYSDQNWMIDEDESEKVAQAEAQDDEASPFMR